MHDDELIIKDEVAHIEVSSVHVKVSARLNWVRCDADRACVVDEDLDAVLDRAADRLDYITTSSTGRW